MTLVPGDMTSGEMTLGRLDRLPPKCTARKRIGAGFPLNTSINQGHPTSIFGKYLFGSNLKSRIFGAFVVKFLPCLPKAPYCFSACESFGGEAAIYS